MGFKSSGGMAGDRTGVTQNLMGIQVWEVRMTCESGASCGDINQDKWQNIISSGFKANSDGKAGSIQGPVRGSLVLLSHHCGEEAMT